MKNEASRPAPSLFKTIIGYTKGQLVIKQIRHRCERCQRRAQVIANGQRLCHDHCTTCPGICTEGK